MKVLTYYEIVDLARMIEDKGRVKRTAYEVRKKAKMGRSSSGDLSVNHRMENKEKHQGHQIGMDLVSQSAYKPPARQGTQGSSASQGYYSSGQMHATNPSCQTCGKSHIRQCHILIEACFRYGQSGHRIRDFPQLQRNVSQGSGQVAVPSQTTRNPSGMGSRSRGNGEWVTGSQA